MKVLEINKYHWQKDGGTTSYFTTAEVLRKNGHEVAFFSMRNPKNFETGWSKYFIDWVDYNAKIGIFKKIKLGIKLLYNFDANRKLNRLLDEFKPDIVHLHVIYHQLSPSIINVLRKRKIPMVMTLHDYKLICPNHTLYTKNKVCKKCKDDRYYNCVKYKCIKESWFKSVLGMVEAYLHNRILKTYDKVDMFIAPSKFMKDVCVEFGVPENKIKVAYNCIDADDQLSESKVGDYFLFFGRLSQEKGLDVLLKAFRDSKKEQRLVIAGEGPMRDELIQIIKSYRLEDRVDLVGYKAGQELVALIAGAKAVVIPSVWYENMPFSLLEAKAAGKVVIASDIGGMSEVINHKIDGYLFKAGSHQELALLLDSIGSDELFLISKKAKKSVVSFGKMKYYDNVIKIYNKVIDQVDG